MPGLLSTVNGPDDLRKIPLERFPDHGLDQQVSRCLRDGAALAAEGRFSDHLRVIDPQINADPVPAQRVRSLVGRIRVLQHPEVVGPPVVLQDVVAVEIVHRGSECSAKPQSRP